MRATVFGIGLVLLAASAGATAGDRNGAGAIVAGDYTKAERMLVTERRIFPTRPELMLNLAAVYRQTGRQAEARALYADVLAHEDMLMEMLNRRTVSSHAIARASLARLTQVAAR
jgi:hypothetical protein